MAFTDLFKPKYKHSDRNVRKQAVQELTDENILTEIAYNDESGSVRHEAVKKITNQKVLIDILKTDRDKWVCFGAVEKITDITVLSDVAENHFDDDVRLKAAIKSNNEKVLMELLLKYEDVTYTMKEEYLDALKLITDEDKITKIANQARNKRLRIESINRITNQDTLMDIAVYDKDSKIREKATQKIEDKELLSEKIKEKERIEKEREKYYNVDLAKNNEYHYNRENAIKKINDEEQLEDIALNGNYHDARYWAASKIIDEKRLINIVKNSDDEWVRKKVVTGITDQEVLKDVLENDEDKDVRWEALKKVNQEEVSAETIMNLLSMFEDKRKIIEYVEDEKILCELGKTEDDWFTAAYIASNINDEEVLEYMAMRTYSCYGTIYHQPNQAAIKQIKNKNILLKIYNNTDDYENKITAGEKLKELGCIEDESLNVVKRRMSEEALNDRIDQLRLDIAYADHNSTGDCIELAKLYEQKGNKTGAKEYYKRAIKEIDIIINSTRGDKQHWINEKKDIEERLKNI